MNEFSIDDVTSAEDIALVVGVRGSGKSHLVREAIWQNAHRIIAFDPHHEYGMNHIGLIEFQRAAERGLPEEFAASVTPVGLITDDERAFTDCVRQFTAIIEKHVRNTIIIFEEAGIMEGMKKPQKLLNVLATQSRHWNCPLVYVAQRAFQVPVTVRSQANVVVSLRQSDDGDIRELREKFGSANRALAERIPTLDKHEYVIWRLWEKSDS